MQDIMGIVDSSKKAKNPKYEESNVVSKEALSYIGPLLQTLWESGLLIGVLQGTSLDRRVLSLEMETIVGLYLELMLPIP